MFLDSLRTGRHPALLRDGYGDRPTGRTALPLLRDGYLRRSTFLVLLQSTSLDVTCECLRRTATQRL